MKTVSVRGRSKFYYTLTKRTLAIILPTPNSKFYFFWKMSYSQTTMYTISQVPDPTVWQILKASFIVGVKRTFHFHGKVESKNIMVS